MDRPRLTLGPFCVYHVGMDKIARPGLLKGHLYWDGPTLIARECSKCGELKMADQFGRRSGAGYPGDRVSYCKACHNARNRGQRRTGPSRHREWIIQEKSKPCERCGRNPHWAAMQFDHLPGVDKRFEVGVGCGRSREAIEAEMAKCQLLCANCHAIIGHHRRRPGHKECVSDTACGPETSETAPIV